MQDPFFQARNRLQTIGRGGRNYLEDIHRTYGQKPPRRNNETYEKALKFREREKAQIRAITSENERLRESLAQYESMATEATSVLRAQSETLHLLKSKISHNASTADSSDRGTGSSSKLSVSEPVDSDSRLQREVLPAVLPSTRGSSSEHADEGRSAADERLSEQPTGGSVRAD